MTTSPRPLKEMLADQIEAKDITLEQLSLKSGMPDHHLKAIFNNQVERLPALPYIRTHLLAVADYLNIDREVILEAYRREFSGKISGPADRLPGNRFAFEKKGRKWVWLGLIGIVGLLALFTILRSTFFGAPSFRLVNPPQDAQIYEVTSSVIMLAGTTESNGTLFINGEAVPVREDGAFEFEYQLQPGINTIEFTVERFLGKTITVLKQVVYVEPMNSGDASSTPATTTDPLAEPVI